MTIEAPPAAALPTVAVTRARRAWRADVRRLLLSAANVCFALFLLLTFLTPAWRTGPFAWQPFLHIGLAGRSAWLGPLTLLPLLAILLLAAAHLLLARPSPHAHAPRQAEQQAARLIALPALALGLLTIARLRPAASPGVAFIVLIGVGLFWLTTLWLAHVPARALRRVLSLFFALIVLGQGAVGVGQFVQQRSLGLTALGEPALDPRIEHTSVIGPEGQHHLRAYGLTAHPNLLGGLLAIGLVWVGSGWLGRVPWPGVGARLSAALWLAVGVVGLTGLLASFSRGAWLGLACGGVWLIWRQRGAGRRGLLLSGGLALIVLIFMARQPDLFWGRFFDLNSPLEMRSLVERSLGLASALRIIQEHWLWGVGSGLYVTALQTPGAALVVHNAPLLAAAELGVGGGLLWLWLNWAWLAGRRRVGEQAGLLFDASAASWLALFVIGLVDNHPWLTVSWRAALLLGLLTGALIASLERRSPATPTAEPHA